MMLLLAISITVLSACNGTGSTNPATSGDTTGQDATSGDSVVIKAMQERIQQLTAENSALKLQIKNQGLTDATAPTRTATTIQTATTTPTPIKTTLTDINDLKNTAEIAKMHNLGVFEPLTTKFEPQKPAKRREFARWLVKSANILLTKDNQSPKCIKLAKGSKSSFSDVNSTDSDYPYIEGLNNAGVAIGFDDHTFKPDKPITRAEMFAIKGALDELITTGKADTKEAAAQWYAKATYTDSSKVPQTLAGGMQLASSAGTIERVYGTLRMIKPDDLVTRAQAAMCIAQLGKSQDMTVDKLD